MNNEKTEIEKLERKERLDKVIDKHFEQYDQVFRNLADEKPERKTISNEDIIKGIKESFEEYDYVFRAFVAFDELDTDDNFDKLTEKNFQKYDTVFRKLAKGSE